MLEPIRVSTLTLPESRSRGTITEPSAVDRVDHACRERTAERLEQRLEQEDADLGGLNTMVLPMMSAGISVAKVSFRG